MSDFDDLLREVIRLGQRLAEVEHKNTNMLRVGTIEQVDGKKGYQIKFAEEDGKAVPSPWFPHPEQGGAYKTWRPLTKGQIVYAICPDGDPRQGFIMPKGGFSDQNPQPSERTDENVDTFGDWKMTLTKDGHVMSWGENNSITFGKDGVVEKIGDHVRRTTKDGTKFENGKVQHDDRNIGKDHVHSGVKSGGEKSGNPEA
ncbi:baseplate assembly protein [Methylobacterium nigriterrae]|uniref:baseplate assembly protein n=1 Tax=Methylobacterium nigriterrae TaxID=3127512 RepID=UPI00301354FE